MSSSTAAGETRLLDPVAGKDVPKVDNAIAVGEDLRFQENWWTFERIIWSFFLLILLADVLGVFGAGWFAHKRLEIAGSGMEIRYDRVARSATPDTLAIRFGADAPKSGHVTLITSESVVRGLGAQRVIPQPETSAIAEGHMVYTFPVHDGGEVDFELQPATPGIYSFTLQVQGHPAVSRKVVVMP